MRLDKFLKVSRLIKRRTSAAQASDIGRVLVNGIAAKPSKQLKEGDIITILFSDKEIKAKVLRIPDGNVSIQESVSLYEAL